MLQAVGFVSSLLVTGTSGHLTFTQTQVPLSSALCYMQGTGQEIVSLDQLCQQQTPELRPNSEQAVVVTEITRSGNEVIGQVHNHTGRPVTSVIVNYKVVGEKGTPEMAGFAFTEKMTLNPNETSSFRGEISSIGQIQVTTVEWQTVP